MIPAACASVAILTKIGRTVEAGALTRRVVKAKIGVRHERRHRPGGPYFVDPLVTIKPKEWKI